MTTSPTELFSIVPGARDDGIIVGSKSAVMENIVDSVARNDAIEEAAKAVVDAEEARELKAEAERLQEMAKTNTVQMITDSINRNLARFDAYLARRDAEEEEAEQRRIQDEMASLPDPDTPDPLGHQNTGDLHTLTPHDSDQAEFEEPEDPTGVSIPQPIAAEFDGD
jgi:hypothetical protein